MKKIIFCIGNGRDGTKSLALNLESVAKLNDKKVNVFHELYVSDIYKTFHNNHDNLKILEKKLDVIASRFKIGNIYISNGYTLFINSLIKKFGDKLLLIRIKRNKNSWKKSFLKNINLCPASHGNYSKVINPKIYRMSAWHFNEVSQKKWNKSSLSNKIDWYYRKNDFLINKAKNKIKSNNFLFLKTEDSGKLTTMKLVTKFINNKWKCKDKPLKINTTIPISYYRNSNLTEKILHSFYQEFDLKLAALNPVWGANFFIKKTIWGYKNRKKFNFGKISQSKLNFFYKDLIYFSRMIKKHVKN